MKPDEIKAFLIGHSEATKCMIEILVKEKNRKFEKLDKEMFDLINENRQLKDSLQFSQDEIDENKAAITELNYENKAIKIELM